MPPKRKRGEDTTAATAEGTRSTRSSTRTAAASNGKSTAKAPSAAAKATKSKTTKKKPAKEEESDNEDEVEDVPAPKKAKKATTSKGKSKTATKKDEGDAEDAPAKKTKATKSTAKSTAKKKSAKVSDSTLVETVDEKKRPADDDDAESDAAVSKTTKVALPASTSSSSKKNLVPDPKPKAKEKEKKEPYTAPRALALFDTYADDDDRDVIGPEGLERLCTDADISMEGALPIVLAWQLGAKEMGKFSKDEWGAGMEVLKICTLPALATALTDLEDLLILDKPPKDVNASTAVVSPSKKKDKDKGKEEEPYDRTRYRQYAADRTGAFTKLYSFCFAFAKAEQSRNIDMQTSQAFWSVLLVPKYKIITEVLEFIEEKGTYRATNKDLWNMMLEFCRNVDPELKDYESDGAWPTLIDEFVSWKQDKMKE